jgi:hypothetical protein
MKTNFFPIVLGSVLLLSLGSSPSLFADGPYHGKVIDRNTKQPIEGAAIVAVWWKQTPMIADSQTSYYDAQDTLTDKEGNFTIPGVMKILINPLAKIREPSFTIFKPGYTAYRNLVFKPRSTAEGIVVFEESGQVVYALGRLTTREERLRNIDGLLPGVCFPDTKQFCVPEEKILNLRRLMNAERKTLGLEPTYAPKGGSQ